MGVTKLTLKRPVSALMVILATVVFGVTAVWGFRMEQLPDVEMPILFVRTAYTGADSGTVEEMVSTEIEKMVRTLDGIESIRSYSYDDYSMVMLQYEYGTDAAQNYTDLRNTLDSMKESLPEGAENPVIIEMNENAAPSVRLSVSSEKGEDVLAFLDEGLLKELENLSSVAGVEVSGGERSYIRVELKEDMLDQYGLNMQKVAEFVTSAEFTVPIGAVEQGKQTISVSSSVNGSTIQEIRDIPLYNDAGSLIRLEDVANVSMAMKEPESISRIDGTENVTLNIIKKQNAGTVEVSESVRALIEKYQAQNGRFQFEIIDDSADDVISALKSAGITLLLGIVLSVILLLLFFGDIRAGLVVGSSIPLSLCITLICMRCMGFTLNVVTTGALIIAIGMIVDASIVVLDSCYRVRDEGIALKKTALEGTRIVFGSIVTAIVTTIAVYLPLIMMKGLTGQLFSQLGSTIIFAMIASLIAAVAFVPLFFVLLKPAEKKELKVNRWLEKVLLWYEGNVRRLMQRKKTTIAAAVLLLAAAAGLAAFSDVELLPEVDRSFVDLRVDFRSGTKLSVIDKEIVALEQMLDGFEDVESYSMTASGSSAKVRIRLKENRKMSASNFREELKEQTEALANMDVRIIKDNVDFMSGTEEGAQIILTGYDLNAIKKQAAIAAEQCRAVKGVLTVTSSAETADTKLEVIVDPLKAMNYGLTPLQVAETLSGMVSGQEVLKVTDHGREYSVVLEFPEGTYSTPNTLKTASIPTDSGSKVLLSEIASLEYTDGQDCITKQDGRYQVTIQADCLKKDRNYVQKAVDMIAENLDLPATVQLGENSIREMMDEELTALLKAVLAAVFLVFIIIAIHFESAKHALMIMLGIPFALIGSCLLMFITGTAVNIITLMGMLMLAGIAVNQGILYVDSVRHLSDRMSMEDALAESGKIRIRPMLITTLIMILSVLPLAIGLGKGIVVMQGMAIVMIGGLITSAVLVLFLFPGFYLLLNRKKDAH
ncbi:MAG: efflux RND transporter permease subunit [Lachnospiraceae bacterium]